MCVVGSEVVAKLVGDHVQIPRIAVDVVVGAVGQVGAESVGIRTTVHVEPRDATVPVLVRLEIKCAMSRWTEFKALLVCQVDPEVV